MRKNKRYKGFILIEVLISIIILCSAIIVINRAFSISLRAIKSARDNILANSILQDRLFDLEIRQTFADTKKSDTIQLGQKEFDYTLEVSAPNIRNDKDESLKALSIKQARLNISWTDANNKNQYGISTYVWEEKE